MKKKLFTLSLLSLLSYNLILTPANAEIISSYKIAEASVDKNSQPYSIIMPSTNYNQRAENIKIDTIIIHHTAPFASLTRVGYFFQDINSRVSSHYILGKEGLIIQSVDEKDRSWHAGISSWMGKYNVNDYSIGIEVLNDGDNKDPFTELQYNSLTKLVAYLMKKYDIPLSRVIGHRDIAIPMGRKTDPADNFDWKAFKSRIRNELKISGNFLGMGDQPQDSNVNATDVVKGLKSNSADERSLAVDSLLTFPYKSIQSEVESAFTKEYSEPVMSKFFRLFEAYEEKKYVAPARVLLGKYNSISNNLFTAVVSYLNTFDKDNSLSVFTDIFNDDNLNIDKKTTLVKFISNYKNDKVMSLLLDELKNTNSLDEKKVIIESLAKFENKSLNPLLITYLMSNNTDIKIATADTLRVTFDENVENKLIDLLKKETNQDVLEIIVSTMMRKNSLKGINNLQNENIYKKLNVKTKVMLINSIGRLQVTDSENWLINKINQEKDENLKSALFLAAGRLKGEKSFSVLTENFGKGTFSDLVILRALSNYNKPEFTRTLKTVLEKESIPKVLKMEALSIIKENKKNDLAINLKALSVENSDPEIQFFTEEVIKSLESQ